MATTKQDLKARRVEAKITRKQAAEACGISQFRLDRVERGEDVDDETRKAYDAGLAKLLKQAEHLAGRTTTKAAPKTANSNGTGTTKPRTSARTRKTAQSKPKAEEPAA